MILHNANTLIASNQHTFSSIIHQDCDTFFMSHKTNLNNHYQKYLRDVLAPEKKNEFKAFSTINVFLHYLLDLRLNLSVINKVMKAYISVNVICSNSDLLYIFRVSVIKVGSLYHRCAFFQCVQ